MIDGEAPVVAQAGRSPRGGETGASLIEAAITLFGKQGYDGVTTRELAGAARTNVSSIRYHFGGKDGLYRAALEQVTAEIQELVEPRLASLEAGIRTAGTDREQLATLARAFVASWARGVLSERRTQRRMPYVMRELTSPSRHFNLIYERFYRRFLDVFALLVGARNHADPADPATRVRTYAALHVLMCFIEGEVVFWRQMGWNRYTPDRVEQMLPTLCDTFVDTLGGSNGVRPVKST